VVKGRLGVDEQARCLEGANRQSIAVQRFTVARCAGKPPALERSVRIASLSGILHYGRPGHWSRLQPSVTVCGPLFS